MSPMSDNINLFADKNNEQKVENKDQFASHNRPAGQEGAPAPVNNTENSVEQTPIIKSSRSSETPSPLASVIRPSIIKPKEEGKKSDEPDKGKSQNGENDKKQDQAKEQQRGQDQEKSQESGRGSQMGQGFNSGDRNKKSAGELKQKMGMSRRQTATAEKPEAKTAGVEEKNAPKSLYENKQYIKKNVLKYNLWKSDNLRDMTRLGRKDRAALADEFFPDRTFVRKEDVDKVVRGIESGKIKPPASLGTGRAARTRATNILRGFRGERPKRIKF